MKPKHILCLMALLSGLTAALVILHPLFLILSLAMILMFLRQALIYLNDSRTDALTGVRNLRSLEGQRNHYSRVSNLTVIYVDVDKLKRINDNHGHENGNKALKAVANCMRKAANGNGTVYRIGGDEFLLVAEEPDAQFMQRWEQTIAELPRVTVSWGHATGLGTQLDGLIRTAERNMYLKKRNAEHP